MELLAALMLTTTTSRYGYGVLTHFHEIRSVITKRLKRHPHGRKNMYKYKIRRAPQYQYVKRTTLQAAVLHPVSLRKQIMVRDTELIGSTGKEDTGCKDISPGKLFHRFVTTTLPFRGGGLLELEKGYLLSWKRIT